MEIMTKKGPVFGPQNVRKSRRAKMGLPSICSEDFASLGGQVFYKHHWLRWNDDAQCAGTASEDGLSSRDADSGLAIFYHILRTGYCEHIAH